MRLDSISECEWMKQRAALIKALEELARYLGPELRSETPGAGPGLIWQASAVKPLGFTPTSRPKWVTIQSALTPP